MKDKDLMQAMRGTILEQQETISAMNTQIEKISAEFLGFKLAFIRLAAFLPLTERDSTAARELAIAQAEDAIEQGEMSFDRKLSVFLTIQSVMEVSGEAWRASQGR